MRTRVVRARSVAEVLGALGDGASVLAGGTDLMVAWRHGEAMPETVVDVSGVDELRGIRVENDELRIGASTTCAELVASPQVRARADVLAAAAAEVGAVQIRERATVGGNLGSASPAADLAPAWMVLQARVLLRSVRGVRAVPIGEFFCGYRRTERRPDELIEAVVVPPCAAAQRRGFRKVGTRRAQSISKVVVAAGLTVVEGRVASLRAAAGSVAPRTVELVTLREELAGQAPTPERIARAVAACVRADTAPIDDVRSTGAYRRAVLHRVLCTMLGELARPRAR